MRPTAVPNLAFWFPAEDDAVVLAAGLVATWRDKSGGSHDITAAPGNRGTWLEDAGDGAPAIAFFGGAAAFDPLPGVVSTAGPFSLLINCQVRPVAGNGYVGEVPLTLAAASGPASLSLHTDPRFRNAAELRYFTAAGHEVGPPASRPYVGLATWLPILVRYPNDGTVRLRVGFDTADVQLTTGGANGSTGLVVGSHYLNGAGHGAFTGLIREVMGFSRSISDVEWNGLLEWMAASSQPDTTPPVISNVSPTPGVAIRPTQALSVNVTDDSGAFRRIYLLARFAATGAVEVIHDGDAFTGLYAAGSSRVGIANGFRYTVARRSGWPSAPTLTIDPIDTHGNEA